MGLRTFAKAALSGPASQPASQPAAAAPSATPDPRCNDTTVGLKTDALPQATKTTPTVTPPSTRQRETARRKSIESAASTPAFANTQAQCESVGVRREVENLRPYAKAKADALLLSFATAVNPHPAKKYQQHPSVADLSHALTQMRSATDPTAEQKQKILDLVMDVLGNDREVLQRLGKALGLKDIPTAKASTRAKVFLQGKAAADARKRESNLNDGIVDKLVELSGVCDAMVGTDNKLARLCSLAPLQLNHVLLNFSHGRQGTDVLGLLAAVTGEVDPRHATEVDHSKKIQAVCEAEKKLGEDTQQVVHDAEYRPQLPEHYMRHTPCLLVGIPLTAAGKVNKRMYKSKLENTGTTPVNIPRNKKFIDQSNWIFRGGYINPRSYGIEPNAGDLISILRQDHDLLCKLALP
jgi:hypothetical protein